MQLPDQLNIEYIYRIIYECLRGVCYGTADGSRFSALLAQVWLWIVIIGYVFAVIGLIAIVYLTIRIFELRKREEEYYGTLLLAPDAGAVNPRWLHIESLAKSANPSDLRAAIVEADILLDDMLTTQGYSGEGVAEKLKNVERADFATRDDAWTAHKVRNQIAHEGSAFDLSETLARRTLAHYEAVFREFGML